MKRLIPLTILTILLGFNMKAQSLIVEDTLVHINFTGTESIQIKDVLVRNSSPDETINVYWERITNNIPNGYISYICDNNICYGAGQSVCPPENPNIMNPDYEFKFKMNLERAGNEEGSGLIEVLIWEEGFENQAVKVKFLVNEPTSSNNFNKTALKVYPNPADNYFRIEGIQDISQAVIFNIVGEQMMSFPVTSDRSYDISQLNSGIYLVKLIRGNGKIAKTIRLSKR